MGDAWFKTNAAQEPRLAPYATTAQPAWLWSADGERILWCNAAGLAALGAGDPGLLQKPRSLADPHRRQVSQLARRLPRDGTTRLERLRGFGARLGQLMTCACSRFELETGESAILGNKTEKSCIGFKLLMSTLISPLSPSDPPNMLTEEAKVWRTAGSGSE